MGDRALICVVGVGRAGMVHAGNFRTRVPEAVLDAGVDAEPERAAQAARDLDLAGRSYTSLEAASGARDIDAVVITTPTFTHAELTLTRRRQPQRDQLWLLARHLA